MDSLILCLPCAAAGLIHPAFFVVAGDSVCIRHAAELVRGDDDMRAHDLAHLLYNALHDRGITDTY